MTTTPDPKNEKLLWSYTQRPVEQTRDFYDNWAETYDNELIEDLEYAAPREGVRIFCDVVPDKEARILEAGCGTGIAGRLLARRGYRNLHGMDLSPGMLHQAAKTGAYQSLHQHDLTQPIETDEKFDAALCIGVYAYGPIFAADFRNILCAIPSGAPLVVTVNGKAWVELDWQKMIDEAAADGVYTIEAIHRTDYLKAENIDGRVLVLRAL